MSFWNFVKKLLQPLLRSPASRDVSLSSTAKFFGGSVPLISVAIVIFQIYSSADEDTILGSSGVQPIASQTWTVKAYSPNPIIDRNCLETACIQNLESLFATTGIELPKDDPLGNKKWDIPVGGQVSYTTTINAKELTALSDPVLYIPGIRGKHVSIAVNGVQQIDSTANLPFFVKLPPRGTINARVEVVLTTSGQQAYQGFIRSRMFTGEVQTVYRAHYRLSFRSFPRQAVILFLLSTGALTFAFFIFLDRKRELFALGVAISLLGVAEAVKVGIVPFLGSKSLFVFFSLHMVFLAWYGLELAKISASILGLLAIWSGFMALFMTSQALSQNIGEDIRFWSLQAINCVPLIVAALDFSIIRKVIRANREQAMHAALAAGALAFYGGYLFVSDFESSLPFKLISMYEIPVLLCVSVWITAALSNLGSLEARVQAAVVDREKRMQMEQDLRLAEAVQTAFINPGRQTSDFYDVHTIYKAAKSVGGDWLAWKQLPGEYSLAIIADVVGKGVQAGLIVSACDAALNLLMPDINPAFEGADQSIRKIVAALHRAVLSFHLNRAMTALILIGTRKGQFTFTSLGHPPLVVLGGEKSRIVTTPNNWLSRNFDQSRLNIKTVDLHPGETAVAYTDGVCDGSRQLKTLEKQWREWAHLPLSQMVAHFENLNLNPDRDDQSVMLIRFKEAGETETAA